jgi:esterase/lipase
MKGGMSAILKPSYLEELPFRGDEEKILLCAHGLNQKPSALKVLLTDMNEMGFKTYLMHLPGHFGETDFSHLRASHYFEAHKRSYDYLKQKHNKKIYFLGYSFGGLIGVHHFDACPFEKMILIAPALKLHGYTSLIKPFLPHINRIVSIKLGHPQYEERYRYHQKGVPAEVYSSFFSVYSSNKFKDKSLAKQAEALVMVHPRDELVSFWKLRRWVNKKTNWKFTSLDNKGAEFRRYNHLCFDPTTLGPRSYQNLLSEIQKFL